MNNLSIIKFAEAYRPKFKEKKGVGYVEYGERNDYPNYLLELFSNSAKHQSLIKGKVNYICGNGWVAKDIAGELFVKHANQLESLDEVTKKLALDIEIFGGAYLEIIWSRNGMISDIYHIDYTKIRSNKDNTQYWFKQDWKNRQEEAKIFNAFNPNLRIGSQIMYIKEYRAGVDTYALPSYYGGLNYICSDIEVSKHIYGNALTGFTPSKLITLPNGEPSSEEKRDIERRFEDKFTGSDGKKFLLSYVANAEQKPIIEDLGASDLTKEDYANVDILIRENIFASHQISNPALFGISEAGKLGSRQELRDAYEIFKNTYVRYKQNQIENAINIIAKYKNVVEEMFIQDVEPIGIEFSENIIASVAPKEWILEKLGIDASKYQTQTIAPVQMSEQLDFEEQTFAEFGVSFDDYEIVNRKEIDGRLGFIANQLVSDILDLINKDNKVTNEVLAKVLNVDIDVINTAIEDLKSLSALSEGTKDGVIIRKLTAPLAELQKGIDSKMTRFQVMYSYEKRDIAEGDNILKTTRDFCRKIIRARKLYSRPDIEKMSAKLGYSVFDRAGGWWTMPDGEHSPQCRHTWVANIVKLKK